MRTILAPHWIPYHRDGADREIFGWWQPPAVKLVTDAIATPYVQDMPPDARLIVRHYPTSDPADRGFITPTRAGAAALVAQADAAVYEGSGRDAGRADQDAGVFRATVISLAEAGPSRTPEQLGVYHAQVAGEMMDYLKTQGVAPERVWFEGLNEPMLWSVEPPETIARYERTRLIEMHKRGLQSVVGNFGVGWPGNGGVQDAPVAWDWFAPVMAVWGQHDHLGLHEYWYLNGPGENWRWWGGRFAQCPFRVPIDITECGIDCGVVPGQAGSGWLRLPEPSLRDRARHYLNDLAWYEAQCLADGRVRSICIFTYDGNERHWSGFGIKQNDWLLEFHDWLSKRPELPAAQPITPPPPPPVIVKDVLLAALQTEFGAQYQDWRQSLPTNATAQYPFPSRASGSVDTVVIHHDAVKQAAIPDLRERASVIARAHLGRGYTGAAYGFLIGPDGMVAQLNGLDRVTWHAGNREVNYRSVGVCFAGDYRTDQPTAAALTAWRRLLGVLELFLGRPLAVLGHRECSATECPGEMLWQALHAAPAEPLPEGEGRLTPEKWRRWQEEAIRMLEEQRYDRARAILLSLVRVAYRLEMGQ